MIQLNEKVQALINACGANVYGYREARAKFGIHFDFFMFMCAGQYAQDRDIIMLNEVASDLDYTALHELTHWSGIAGRSMRPVMQASRDEALYPTGWRPTVEQVATEEMTAMFGMFYLAVGLQLDVEHARRVLTNYHKMFPSADLKQAEVDGQRAAEWLLNFLQKEQVA